MLSWHHFLFVGKEVMLGCSDSLPSSYGVSRYKSTQTGSALHVTVRLGISYAACILLSRKVSTRGFDRECQLSFVDNRNSWTGSLPQMIMYVRLLDWIFRPQYETKLMYRLHDVGSRDSSRILTTRMLESWNETHARPPEALDVWL
jgi:hypothetical protein